MTQNDVIKLEFVVEYCNTLDSRVELCISIQNADIEIVVFLNQIVLQVHHIYDITSTKECFDLAHDFCRILLYIISCVVVIKLKTEF